MSNSLALTGLRCEESSPKWHNPKNGSLVTIQNFIISVTILEKYLLSLKLFPTTKHGSDTA